MSTRAIILAAGRGTRAAGATQGKPKCLLDVRGKPILARQLEALDGAGVTDVTVVTGYAADEIRASFGDRVAYYHYSDYARTNNLHTLHAASHLLDGPVLVLFADVLVTRESMRRLAGSAADLRLLVDTSACRDSTMRVAIEDDCVVDLGNHIDTTTGDGNFVGLAGYSGRGARLLAAELERMADNPEVRDAYYTAALPRIVRAGERVEAIRIDGEPWVEVDDLVDYDAALAHDFYL